MHCYILPHFCRHDPGQCVWCNLSSPVRQSSPQSQLAILHGLLAEHSCGVSCYVVNAKSIFCWWKILLFLLLPFLILDTRVQKVNWGHLCGLPSIYVNFAHSVILWFDFLMKNYNVIISSYFIKASPPITQWVERLKWALRILKTVVLWAIHSMVPTLQTFTVWVQPTGCNLTWFTLYGCIRPLTPIINFLLLGVIKVCGCLGVRGIFFNQKSRFLDASTYSHYPRIPAYSMRKLR